MSSLPDPTPESIQRAYRWMLAERAKVEADIGLKLDWDGRRIKPSPLYIVGCPKSGCDHTSSAKTDGRALRGIAAHLVRSHQGEAS